MRVYLAGPITGTTFDDANDWRLEATRKLKKIDIIAYNPLRKKYGLRNKGKLKPDSETQLSGSENTPKAVLLRDFLDCTKANALLVYLPDLKRGEYPSVGTCQEIGFAWERHIPTVVITPDDSWYTKHPMIIGEISHRVDSIDEGIRVIRNLLLP